MMTLDALIDDLMTLRAEYGGRLPVTLADRAPIGPPHYERAAQAVILMSRDADQYRLYRDAFEAGLDEARR